MTPTSYNKKAKSDNEHVFIIFILLDLLLAHLGSYFVSKFKSVSFSGSLGITSNFVSAPFFGTYII